MNKLCHTYWFPCNQFAYWLMCVEYSCVLSIHVCWVFVCMEYSCVLSVHVCWVFLCIEYSCVLCIHVCWVIMCVEYSCVLSNHAYWAFMCIEYSCVLSIHTCWVPVRATKAKLNDFLPILHVLALSTRTRPIYWFPRYPCTDWFMCVEQAYVLSASTSTKDQT